MLLYPLDVTLLPRVLRYSRCLHGSIASLKRLLFQLSADCGGHAMHACIGAPLALHACVCEREAEVEVMFCQLTPWLWRLINNERASETPTPAPWLCKAEDKLHPLFFPTRENVWGTALSFLVVGYVQSCQCWSQAWKWRRNHYMNCLPLHV